MSEAVIERFVDCGFIKEFSDFYQLDLFEKEIVAMEGFGRKSYENIIAAAEESRKNASFIKLVHALGIPDIGKGQAKAIYQFYRKNEENEGCDYINNLISDLESGADMTRIPTIGEILQQSLRNWAETAVKCGTSEFRRLLIKAGLEFKTEASGGTVLSGMTFVITGSLKNYENREALVKVIEANGGKASGSVSAKTSYLINNDSTSTSGKNKKAQELGVKIITEDEFMALLKP